MKLSKCVRKRSEDKNGGKDAKTQSILGIEAPVMEAYRILRTNIDFSKSVNKIRKILLTSSVMGEGKSTTALNLARVFALGGTKTLIIDLDLRRPVIHKFLGIENRDGIMDCMLDRVSCEDIIKPSGFENLSVVVCGEKPSTPAEILASEKLSSIVDTLQEKFDIVIIDSPPSTALADASIISRFTDATILVVSAGNVTYPDIDSALDNLSKAGAKVLGLVMNNVTRHSRGYKYYYYDY